MRFFGVLLALAPLASRSIAAAIDRALYEASDPALSTRDNAPTCGGIEGLSTCGNDFPSDFCCPAKSVCLLLNANETTAAICCPEGSDCKFIQTIQCDKSALDPAKNPTSPVHASPIIDMPTCGEQCCPPGYECDPAEDSCNRIVADTGSDATTSALISATSTFPTASTSLAITSTVSSVDSGITVIPTASSNAEADASHASTFGPQDTRQHFSGKSFAAGFVPGIFLGLLGAAAVIWFVFRQRKRNNSYVDHEKRDTLTPVSRSDSDPNMRSISDPIVRESYAHRTEFSRGQSPPRIPEADFDHVSQGAQASSPYNPQSQQKIRPLFGGRSPMTTPKPTQSPLPQHCNRGTINWPKAIPTLMPAKSFHISPIRGLNRKKSVNSLRRHARTESAASDASTQRLTNTTTLNRKDSEASTGTIKLSFPEAEKYASPDMRKATQQSEFESSGARNHQPENLDSTMYQSPPVGGFTPAAASSHYPDDSPRERTFTTSMIPPPIPLHVANPDFSSSSNGSSSESSSSSAAMQNTKPHLGSPYTPTRKPSSNTVGKATRMLGGVGGGLTVQREPTDRPLPPATLGVPTSDVEHDLRRDTTFSGMMRKAGLTNSYLYVSRN